MNEIPSTSQRIILVNPTRYLGNLLIAGGLIQDFAEHCQQRDIEFRLVVDEAFAGLLANDFTPGTLIAYPRQRIARGGWLTKARLYLGCLWEIRRFRADIAFNIEEDAVSHRLTQFSGAGFRLGCSTLRHQRGYEKVLPVNFAARAADQQHRWYSFREVFAALGLESSQPSYLRLHPAPLPDGFKAELEGCGVDFSRRIAVLHAGATKQYKKWPQTNFAEVATQLLHQDWQVVLIGAGKDKTEIDAILDLLDADTRQAVINLHGRLSLAQLASFLANAGLIVGNDSGPFHLAAALGVKGVVIFGPTRVDLWGPLSGKTLVLKDGAACSPTCTRHDCIHDYRCLKAISPARVLEALASL